jgi:RNA polymerase sigma factor (sigma-70 family)
MAGNRIPSLIQKLRRAVAPDAGAMADAVLLEQFVTQRDERAFELLAWRHAAMVQGVCRRILGNVHEVEDAFQATFLLLARKAAAAARHQSVGGWLYTVAYRVALRARARHFARIAREHPLIEPPPVTGPDPADQAMWREAQRVIDEEVSRLPEKYRVPFVLFHLEGRSIAEVARELNCPIGTVESWLTRARQRLRDRLVRRGVTPGAGLFTALAPERETAPETAQVLRGAGAAAPGSSGAVSAEATALAEGVVRSLGTAKARAAFVLFAGATACTLGLAMRARHEPVAHPLTPAASWQDEAGPAAPVRFGKPVALGTLTGHNSGINAIALSPDGRTLASGGQDCQVKLWDVETRRERATLQQKTRLPEAQRQAHKSPVFAVTFSPDGKTLASAGGSDLTVRLWNVATGEEKKIFRVDTFEVYAVAFSSDGKALAVAGGASPAGLDRTIRWSFDEIPKDENWYRESGEVRVWDLATQKDRTFFRGDTGRVHAVQFSLDGTTLTAGLRDGAIRRWDATSGKELDPLRENAAGAVRGLAISPDGKTLAAAIVNGSENVVELWDLLSGQARARLKAPIMVWCIAFGPDGTLAIAGNVPPSDLQHYYDTSGEVWFWHAATGRLHPMPLRFPHYGQSVAFDGSGTTLAAAGGRGSQRALGQGSGEISLWALTRQDATAP